MGAERGRLSPCVIFIIRCYFPLSYKFMYVNVAMFGYCDTRSKGSLSKATPNGFVPRIVPLHRYALAVTIATSFQLKTPDRYLELATIRDAGWDGKLVATPKCNLSTLKSKIITNSKINFGAFIEQVFEVLSLFGDQIVSNELHIYKIQLLLKLCVHNFEDKI